MSNRPRWAASLALVSAALMPAAAHGAGGTSATGERRWSIFMEDVFEADRNVGLRWRLWGRGAISVAGRLGYERRDAAGSEVETSSLTVIAGYRQYLTAGGTRGFLDLEGSYQRDSIDSVTLSSVRPGGGGGVFVGVEHFFAPSLSVAGRVGVAARHREEEAGGDTLVTVFRSGVALSFHW